MLAVKTTTLLFALYAAQSSLAQDDHGEEAAKEMGPVAFMWPPDREWGAAQDNHPPCGSAQSVVERTDFPLLNGQIALVSQDESWAINVAISYSNNPTSNNDFETLIDGAHITSLAEGHQCYPVPNPPADIEASRNATLQIRYISDFEEDRNQTFYACADITYVPTSQFTYQVPCFNATVDDFDLPDGDDDDSDDSNETSSASAAGASATSSVSGTSESSSSGLSGGAIAGIVIGVVVGVGAVLGLLLFMWRRSQQKKRLREQEASLRTVKWDQQNPTGSQTSEGGIPMKPL